MRRAIVLAGTAMLVAAIVWPAAVAAQPVTAGLVTDVAGLGDNSFNDGAYAGLVRAESDFGVAIDALESATDADYGPNIDTLASGGSDVVFAVGFLMTDITTSKALEYPGTLFAGVDMYYETPSANLLGLNFKENEASYLAGVLGGLGTLDPGLDPRINDQNTIAFIGGVDVPAVEAFQVGFIAGARSVNPDVEVLSYYADSFADEARGEELALEAIAQGADIVFAAAGGTGLGAITACQDAGALFIGVDSDQYLTVPGSGNVMLTSAIKLVDVAVYETVRDVVGGTFVGGQNLEFGLVEGGVGLAPFHDFDAAVSQEIRAAIETARLDVVEGRVVIPTQRSELLDLVTEGVLTVGTDPYFPPFEFMEGAEYRGFDVDMVAAIAERLGLDYAFVDYPFDELIGGLAAGDQIDMIAAAMTITPERAALVDFSDPYLEDPWAPGYDDGFAFNKANPALRDAVNAALADMMADGTYDAIYNSWFGEATPVAVGTDVTVPVVVSTDGGDVEVTVIFDQVTGSGTLMVSSQPSSPGGLPQGYKILGDGRFDISFTGTFEGDIEIGFPYNPAIPDARARNLKVQHWKDNGWVDVTDRVDTVEHLVWARVTSLSPFVLVEPSAVWMPVYRFYNVRTGVHFYTASETEKANVIANLSAIYHYEGVSYQINTANPVNSVPLHRFYNAKAGVHFYTASESEKASVIANLSHIYKYEGVAYKVSSTPTPKPVWRFYNFKKGVHFYTADPNEKDNVVANLSWTYKLDGVGYYIGQ